LLGGLSSSGVVRQRRDGGGVRHEDRLSLRVRRPRYLWLRSRRLLRPFLPVRGRRKGVVQGRARVPDRDAVLRSARLRRLVYGELLRGVRAAERVRSLNHRRSSYGSRGRTRRGLHEPQASGLSRRVRIRQGMIVDGTQQPLKQVYPAAHDAGSTPPGVHAIVPLGHMGGGGGAPPAPPPPLLVPAQ
jgi:hypothetical protein